MKNLAIISVFILIITIFIIISVSAGEVKVCCKRTYDPTAYDPYSIGAPFASTFTEVFEDRYVGTYDSDYLRTYTGSRAGLACNKAQESSAGISFGIVCECGEEKECTDSDDKQTCFCSEPCGLRPPCLPSSEDAGEPVQRECTEGETKNMRGVCFGGGSGLGGGSGVTVVAVCIGGKWVPSYWKTRGTEITCKTCNGVNNEMQKCEVVDNTARCVKIRDCPVGDEYFRIFGSYDYSRDTPAYYLKLLDEWEKSRKTGGGDEGGYYEIPASEGTAYTTAGTPLGTDSAVASTNDYYTTVTDTASATYSSSSQTDTQTIASAPTTEPTVATTTTPITGYAMGLGNGFSYAPIIIFIVFIFLVYLFVKRKG